jgi:hypothetical protein
MAKKRKSSISRRLTRVFGIKIAEIRLALVESDTVQRELSWDDAWERPEIIVPLLHELFSLTEHPGDAPLMKAFARAKLNPKDPVHWRVLLHFLAYALFGGRGRGHPTQWDSMRLAKLLSDFNELRPDLKDESKFVLLRKRDEYKTKKGPISTNYLRRLLKKARDPAFNRLADVQRRAVETASIDPRDPMHILDKLKGELQRVA